MCDPRASEKAFEGEAAAGARSEAEAPAPSRSQQVLARVFESAPEAVMALRAVRESGGRVVDFEWTMANPAAAEMLGRPEAALVGERLLKALPALEEEGFFADCVRVAEGDASREQPVQRDLHHEGAPLQGWFRVSIAEAAEGGVVVFLRTVSEQQAAGEAPREPAGAAAEDLERINAELRLRNRELQDFAHIASHDLQEPLRKVRAFAGLMREDYASAVDETGRYYLERMQDGAERMARLVSDLLSLSRVTTKGDPFETVDLGELAATVRTDLEMRIEETGGRVEIGALPQIEADPTQVRQLLQNLVGNALKFHREGVPPVVTVRGTREPVSTADPNEAEADLALGVSEVCRLKVQDNGIGFEEKFLDRIFTPLQRLHGRDDYEGTGIGLAVCRRIAERHGGYVRAESQPGVGSCFTAVLPVAQPQEEAAPPRGKPHRSAGGTQR